MVILRFIALYILLCFVMHTVFCAATDLTAEFRAGKTFITWSEDSDKTKTYNLYRSSSAITDVSGLAPLVNLPCSTSWDPRHSIRVNIVDQGAPLGDNTGLFVYTPKSSGNAYYAVTTISGTTEETVITPGVNSLTNAVAEAYWEWPQGVVKEFVDEWSPYYIMIFWMDYLDWAHHYNLYYDYFAVRIHNYIKNDSAAPLFLGLHGWSPAAPTIPSPSATAGAVRISVRDDFYPEIDNCWWYGVSNHYGEHPLQAGDTIVDYSAQRVISYVRWITTDPRFKVDTNRVYVGGSSMGGGGSLTLSYHYPNVFAASAPTIARVVYPEASYSGEYGTSVMALTARNGINIYQWMSIPWISENYPGIDFPPLVNQNGSQDGLHPHWHHTLLYQTLTKNRHGIWGQWANIGHQTYSWPEETVAGGVMRFRKDEFYPCFSNASQDDNYGKIDPVESFTEAPAQTDTIQFTAEGFMNGYIDWTSQEHDMGLADDDLIDSQDTLSITFKTSRPPTLVDITPRRIQNFPVTRGTNYKWANIDVASGSTVASGSIVPDENRLITVEQFGISATGNRLVITYDTLQSDCEAGADGLTALRLIAQPNPFNAVIRISVQRSAISVQRVVPQVRIYDISGKMLKSLTRNAECRTQYAFTWNAAGLPSGIYLVKARLGGKTLTRRIYLLK